MRSLPPQAPGPQASAPLARTALLPQGRLVRGGSRSGRSSCGLFLLLPQSSCLLLLLRVALHVGAATLHLEKHPVAGEEGLQSEICLPLWDHRARALARVCVNVSVCVSVCVCCRGSPALPACSAPRGPAPPFNKEADGLPIQWLHSSPKSCQGTSLPWKPRANQEARRKL